ncbi:MAG: hypothetical protein MHPSP_003182, partial [Paramarteilia canceri]
FHREVLRSSFDHDSTNALTLIVIVVIITILPYMNQPCEQNLVAALVYWSCLYQMMCGSCGPLLFEIIIILIGFAPAHGSCFSEEDASKPVGQYGIMKRWNGATVGGIGVG